MEELKVYMQKFEKIKMVIHNFKNDLCPNCGYRLEHLDFVELKSEYYCKGCGLRFWENQFYEMYFDEVLKVMK